MAILKDFIEKTTFEEVWALLETEDTAAYRRPTKVYLGNCGTPAPRKTTPI